MIDGVVLSHLTTHPDDRGFFREVIRSSHPFFKDAFGQWSHSMMYTGTIKAWHVHKVQTDFWYVVSGVIRAVLCDLRNVDNWQKFEPGRDFSKEGLEFWPWVMGPHSPEVLKIPPGVAHGLKVLQGPAHLLYVTSHEYDGSDEGRLPYDSLGFDWHHENIK